MGKKLKLKVLKIVKSIVQWATIIFGAIIAIKVIIDALNPKTTKIVEDAVTVVEKIKKRVDMIEAEKEAIEAKHQQILDDKKDRDEKAKEFFGDL